MGSQSRDNNVPSIVFGSNKVSRFIAIIFTIIIGILMLVMSLMNMDKFTGDTLKGFSELSMTVVLAIIALGISIFQSDKDLLMQTNNEQNIKKVYLSYIFSMFPVILIIVLGYVVAEFFGGVAWIMCLYSIAMIEVLLKSITGTMASFVAFLNIRD